MTFRSTNGTDKWVAAGLTVGGTAATIAISAGVAALGAPVAVTFVGGVIIGVGVDIGVNWLKDKWFE